MQNRWSESSWAQGIGEFLSPVFDAILEHGLHGIGELIAGLFS